MLSYKDALKMIYKNPAMTKSIIQAISLQKKLLNLHFENAAVRGGV